MAIEFKKVDLSCSRQLSKQVREVRLVADGVGSSTGREAALRREWTKHELSVTRPELGRELSGHASGSAVDAMQDAADRQTNGYGGSPEAGSGSDGEGSDEELSLEDSTLPARALAALNALRKSRQHYDVLLVADGEEVPAHRAVLAAASPYLLEALAGASAEPLLRVEGVAAGALRALVEWAYTGKLRAAGGAGARALYAAAWRLRMEAARGALAERLVRRAPPAAAPRLRALPDLAPPHRQHLDQLIAANFEEICSSGALAALPNVTVELMRESSAEDGGEAPRAVADAALAWLRGRPELDLDELCSRTHLLYVDGGGALRDCGELPAARGDAPELREYRREAAERRRRPAARQTSDDVLGARERAAADSAVLAARAAGPRATQALLVVRGVVVAARVLWRPAGGPVARGGRLGHAQEDSPPEPEGEVRASLSDGRCAHGAAALGARLLVSGGYDRARVLHDCEAYDPVTNVWAPLPDMTRARARFPAVTLARTVYVIGGSDGHTELDSVDAFTESGGGRWEPRARLPDARSYAAAAADTDNDVLYVVGGWAGGRSLKTVHRYSPAEDQWSPVAPLSTARSQCAAVTWRGALWALGGCDAWRCLASAECLPLASPAGWAPGPALPTARRSMGGCAWRGRLVLAGGSDGSASLRRVDWLLPPAGDAAPVWQPGPPLRRARAGLGLVELGGALYAAGGFSGREFLACVEWLPAPDAEWTSLTAPPPPAPPLPAPEEEEN